MLLEAHTAVKLFGVASSGNSIKRGRLSWLGDFPEHYANLGPGIHVVWIASVEDYIVVCENPEDSVEAASAQSWVKKPAVRELVYASVFKWLRRFVESAD